MAESAGPIVAPERLAHDTGGALLADVRSALATGARDVTVDLSGVARMDTQGAAYLALATAAAREQGAELRLEGASGKVARLLTLVEQGFAPQPAARRERVGVFEGIGGTAFGAAAEVRDAAGLVVEALYWSVMAPVRGLGLRWGALMDELHEIGVRAIGIVALLNFLLGVIIALLSAAQLQQFGATIYVANLVLVAFARELGAVLTAVIVSARSGAAITAELATMKVQEEIDALRAMGLNVTKFLVAPKLWALVIAVPALTVLAMVAGNLGGSFIGLTLLGESPVRWWDQMAGAAVLGDFGQGLFKSVLFAVIIGLVACHNGLRVRGGARGVGLATTRSVVMDIFFVIVADMVFATAFFFV